MEVHPFQAKRNQLSVDKILSSFFEWISKNFSVPVTNSSEDDSPRDNGTSRTLLGIQQNESAFGRGAAKRRAESMAGRTYACRKEKNAVVGALLAAASAFLAMVCTVAGFLTRRTRSKRRGQSAAAAAAVELQAINHQLVLNPELRRPWLLSYGELAAATSNFAEESKIGRGGFGAVYRGYLSGQERHVAVKVLSGEQSEQGLREFLAEVNVMSQLRHRHIVRLVGWCACRRGLLLVYELMAGGSLDTHLYDHGRLLTWSERYKVALGLGSALLYLHTECDQCVVHGDIKPANVMLDASLNAKLGDFGLARLVDHGADARTTQVVAGTAGYIDPEFVGSRRPRADSDVYSFGVVLLEIASGRRPAAAMLSWVRDMYHRGQVLVAADPRLNDGGELDEAQLQRVLVTGLWCAQLDQSRRPSMAEAMDVLRAGDAELPVLPAASGAGGAERIRSLEERAYGDISDEDSASASAARSSAAASAYFTSMDSANLHADR